MTFIDTHAHLYHKDFDRDMDAMLARCAENGVSKVLLPAIDTESHERMLELAAIANSSVALHPMMGVHPCSINETFEEELAIARQHLHSARKFFAVGEIGLDYYWDKTFSAQQQTAFRTQLQWSVDLQLPVSVHSRNATQDCINIVREFGGKVRGVFHCFGGTVEEAREIIAHGMFLGIGGVVTFKNGGLDKILPQLSLEHFVLETDAPYLAPVPHRGKRNESAYTKLIAEKLAEVMGTSVAEVARITSENATSVFQLA